MTSRQHVVILTAFAPVATVLGALTRLLAALLRGAKNQARHENDLQITRTYTFTLHPCIIYPSDVNKREKYVDTCKCDQVSRSIDCREQPRDLAPPDVSLKRAMRLAL